MGKITFIVCGVLLVVWGVSMWIPGTSVMSPASEITKDTQVELDNKLFEKYRSKVKGEDLKWAINRGELNNYVQEGSYIAVDKNGKVIFEKDSDKKLAPASLTKIMTAMVVLDFVKSDEVFEVTKEAVNLEPTILMVEEGEKLPVLDLLKGSLLTSANDAATVLAYGVSKKLGGSIELFIQLMNEKAKKLGMSNTNFINPTGYDEVNQLSTARDLAKMTNYALSVYPEITKIVSLHDATIEQSITHKYYELPNWNSLLGVYPGVDGVKIGHTDDAGHSMITTSQRNNERFTVVFLGAPDRRARDFWTADLLNSAFEEKGIKKYRVTLNMLQKRSQEWSDQLTRAKEKTIPFGNILNNYSEGGNL